MGGRASAFETLGLEAGADAVAIERAYRRLIKQHHPDREGGDAARAAEIIRAYRELRGGKAVFDPLEFNEELRPRRKPARWPAAAAFAIIGLAAVLLAMGPSVPVDRPIGVAGAQQPGRSGARVPHADPMDSPLHLGAIDAAVQQAVRLYRTQDEIALAAVSRDCHRRLRDEPGTELLDRCAAFDNAVVGLENRDPLRDGGPFAPLAVTGRQWSAASALSDDYLAIDGRLDRIRLRVELALAPQFAEPAPAPPPAGN